MPTLSPAVDAYLAEAPEFARPILEKIRALFHKGCPRLEETIKWGLPHFDYRGVLGSMAAFKKHVSMGFWKGNLLSDPKGVLQGIGNTSMGAFKVADVSELPPDKVLVAFVKEAASLNEQGIKNPAAARKPKKEVEVPDYFLALLKKNPKARATFEAFSPSHKREYVAWITEAKQEETRLKRMATALEWLAEGKSKNWKYERK